MLNYLLDVSSYIFIGAFICILFLCCYEMILKLKGRNISWMQRINILMLGIYLAILFSLTISPMYGFSNKVSFNEINLIPGRAIENIEKNFLNLYGNIVMFMPLGFFVPTISRKFQKISRVCLLGFSISFMIEVIQIFLSRGTDIDDLILNTIGSAFGYLVFVLIKNVSSVYANNTGIRRNKDGKFLKRDSSVVFFLIGIMLFSVMGEGLYKRSDYINQEATKNIGANNNVYKKVQYSEKQKDSRFNSKSFNAKNICIVDVNKSDELYSLDGNSKIAPASTTKMLTALTTLQFCNVDEEVTVGNEIKGVPEDASKAGLRRGNKLTIKQLLEGLLLPSGNDAAYTLAVYTGRKIANNKKLNEDEAINKFVEKMNENAFSMGADSSKFLTPDGYDKEGQYSTAHDLACIASTFMNSDYADGLLKNIVKENRIRECFIDGTDVTWNNTNELLNTESKYYLKNAIGLKTGSSDKAGKCLISAVYINNDLYIAVVMGDTEEGRYIDTNQIYKILKA